MRKIIAYSGKKLSQSPEPTDKIAGAGQATRLPTRLTVISGRDYKNTVDLHKKLCQTTGDIELDLSQCKHLDLDSVSFQLPEDLNVIKLNLAFSDIRPGQINDLLRHCHGDIKLILAGCDHLGSGSFQLPKGLNITYLNLDYSNIPPKQINGLLANCLGDIELDLRGYDFLDSDSFQLPEGLYLRKLNLTRSYIRPEQINGLLKYCLGDIELNLSECPHLGSGSFQLPKGLNVTKLILAYSNVPPNQINDLLANCLGNIELDLTGNNHLDSGSFQLPKGLNVTKLILAYSNIPPNQINDLLKYCFGNIELDLSYHFHLRSGSFQLPEGLLITRLTITNTALAPELVNNLVAHLNSAEALIFPPMSSLASRSFQYNHLNDEGYGFLALINSLSPALRSLKLKLMERVVQTLPPDARDLDHAFRDILFKSPDYISSPILSSFMMAPLLLPVIQDTEDQYVQFQPIELRLIAQTLLALLSTHPNLSDLNTPIQFPAPLSILVLNWPHFSALVNLCLYQMSHHEDPDLQRLRSDLRQRYLDLPPVDSLVQLLQQINLLDQNTFIFIGHKFKMTADTAYIGNAFRIPDQMTEEFNWKDTFVFDSNNSTLPSETLPLNDLFKDILIFKSVYDYACSPPYITQIFKILGFEGHYLDMLNLNLKQVSKENWATPEHHEQLTAQLKDTYQDENGQQTLRPERLDAIFNTFHISPQDSTAKFLILVSFAAGFTKASSSAVFGTEYNSPHSLRGLASAFLNTALAFNHGLELNENIHDTFKDWNHKLHGSNATFTCTAVLYLAMRDKIKTWGGTEALKRALPMAWW